MIEYALVRLILGLAQLALVWRIRRRGIGYLMWLGILLFWSAAINIAPAFPKSDFYKHVIQVPAFIISLVLTVVATFDVFRFLPRRTFPEERSSLAAFCSIVGLVPIVSGWVWTPENDYQAVMIFRQYALVGATGAFWVAWTYLRHLRPVQMDARVAQHGTLWGWWLVTATLLASTTKGGLFWQVRTWTGGAWDWRAASTYLMLAQVLIIWRMWVNLQRWPVATPIGASARRSPLGEPQSDPIYRQSA